MGLSIDYEGLAAIFGYMVLFIGGFFLFAGKWGEKLLIWSIRLLSLLLTIGAVAELVWGPAFNIESVQKVLTPERYQHLLENIYLDYNGSVALTFGNPGFFGGILRTAIWSNDCFRFDRKIYRCKNLGRDFSWRSVF